jgi:hypothetical protein
MTSILRAHFEQFQKKLWLEIKDRTRSIAILENSNKSIRKLVKKYLPVPARLGLD